MIAIHDVMQDREVVPYLNNAWSEYTLTFAQDLIQESGKTVYEQMGGNGNLPMTVVLDENGFVLEKVQAAVTAEQLANMIDPYI